MAHHTYDVKPSADLAHLPEIKGMDYCEGFSLERFFEASATTGFQASNLAHALDVLRIMRREEATVMLASTSNMVSSGVREALAHLCRHRFIDVMVITAGGVEEDVIKLFKPFRLGSFSAPGKQLFDEGINRTGNLFVPNDCYTEFDKFMQGFLPALPERVSSTGFTKALGEAVSELEGHESSYLYWAAKNGIPVICPAIMDGSIGDLVHFHRQQRDFEITAAADFDLLVKMALEAEKAGGIILGGGVAKHYLLNANIFREGLDYTVYINTGEQFDGSDSGARIDEAVSWGKVKARTPAVKVHCDATIAFPLLVAALEK